MAKQKKVVGAEVEQVRPHLEGVAKSLVDRLYGPQGLPWGTPLTELEDMVIAVRQVLSEKMLAQALERQAQTPEQRPERFQRCSGCQGPVEAKPDPEPGNVHTRACEAEWDEPHCYCRRVHDTVSSRFQGRQWVRHGAGANLAGRVRGVRRQQRRKPYLGCQLHPGLGPVAASARKPCRAHRMRIR